MNQVAKVSLVAVLASMSLALHGCGCDVDEASKCLTEKQTGLDQAVNAYIASPTSENLPPICSAVDTYMKCLTDKCCDEDSVKSTANIVADLYAGEPYSCSITRCP